MFDDGSQNSLAPYTEASGRMVDDSAMTLFRLAWTLSDIAAFVALFRSDHGRSEGAEKSSRPPLSRPYGQTPPAES